MTATYPTGVASFIAKVNVSDVIDASHPNTLQEEVVAIESTLGTEPNRSTTPSPSGTFNATTNLFSTVGARLNNIETGVVADTHTQYLRKAGDSANVITANSSAIKGLVLKGAASQSANLLEFQDSAGTVLSYVSPAGAFVGTITPQDLSINNQTANYTILVGTDKNALVVVDSSSAVNITVPLYATSAFPQGSQVNIIRKGTGTVTIVPVSGTVTVGATPGLKLRAQWSSATLIKLDNSNAWALVGDLSA